MKTNVVRQQLVETSIGITFFQDQGSGIIVSLSEEKILWNSFVPFKISWKKVENEYN